MFVKILTLFPDQWIQSRYVEAGLDFGDAVSYQFYMGECVDFESMFNRWARFEREYARRGYRTIALDDFVATGGYGEPLRGVGVQRENGEVATLHAQLYKAVHLE